MATLWPEALDLGSYVTITTISFAHARRYLLLLALHLRTSSLAQIAANNYVSSYSKSYTFFMISTLHDRFLCKKKLTCMVYSIQKDY